MLSILQQLLCPNVYGDRREWFSLAGLAFFLDVEAGAELSDNGG